MKKDPLNLDRSDGSDQGIEKRKPRVDSGLLRITQPYPILYTNSITS
jgi:hypothetical protein